MKNIKNSLLVFITLMISACSWFSSDERPLPTLPHVINQVDVEKAWSRSVGSGTEDNYLKLTPAIDNGTIFTVDPQGRVTAFNAKNGFDLWRQNLETSITSSVGVGNDMVFVASGDAEVFALNQTTGAVVWRESISNQVLAAPVVDGKLLVVKTISGDVIAMNSTTGEKFWTYQNSDPSFILRGASSPVIVGNRILVGFADGKLLSLSKADGALQWQQTIAQPQGTSPLSRLVDIDITPIVSGGTAYVATYQGNVASLQVASGARNWTHRISAFTGMALGSDYLYISDADSNVWAFNLNDGLVNWKLTELERRAITAPVLMADTLVVADGEGYIHWLSQQDGHVLSRVKASIDPIIADPVVEDYMIYVVTVEGRLNAYRIVT